MSHKHSNFQNGKGQLKIKYNTWGRMSRTTQVLNQNSWHPASCAVCNKQQCKRRCAYTVSQNLKKEGRKMKFIIYFFKECEPKYHSRYYFITEDVKYLKQQIEIKSKKENCPFYLTFKIQKNDFRICPQLCKFKTESYLYLD